MSVIEFINSSSEEIISFGLANNINKLAIEDCIAMGQRAKFEEYGDHQYLVWFLNLEGKNIEFHFLLLKDKVALFCNSAPPQEETWGDYLKVPTQNQTGVQIVYNFLDKLMDISEKEAKNYFTKIRQMEKKILTGDIDLESILRLKWRLSKLEFVVSPLGAVIATWRDFLQLDKEQDWKMRDLWDHTVRLDKSIQFYINQSESAINMYWGKASQVANKQMNRLTLVAIIFLPLTFWTSFWGMNFQDIPWGSHYFFIISMIILILSPLIGFLYLKRQGVIKPEDYQ